VKPVICKSKQCLGDCAAKAGADAIRKAIEERGSANIIVATGASQFEMLSTFIKEDIRWDKVTAFHLDEYVGMSILHGASFRKYLWERFVSRLPLPLAAFHYVNGEGDAHAECKRLDAIIKAHPIDVAFVGIGENGHLAFNDPPADFETQDAYLVVNLDEDCRKQQMGEGWFATLDDVPKQAISMGIRQIMASRMIIAAVPDARKAKAVQACVEGPVSNMAPSSIMQQHANAWVYLDPDSASLLKK
jgi:glucosamine-6-phosphate deaminase